jgi:NAD(P)-dependent dehydrogenase (short-subunit alcohol dehydrogenase family)
MSSVESTCQGSVIITGASSGIGIETAEALAEARAEITLAVRNPHAGEQVAARLRISTGNPEIHVRRLDLADPVLCALSLPLGAGRCISS